MRKLLFFLSPAILLACDKVPEPVFDNFVVEAYLFTGEPVREVTIKTLVPLSDPEGESAIIDYATVTIRQAGTDFPLSFNAATRKYGYSGNDLEIRPRDQLHLRVVVHGRIATATTTVPTLPVNVQLSKTQMVIPEIESGADFISGDPLADAELTVHWSNPDNELHYTVIEFRSNVLDPILPPDVQEVVDNILEDFAIVTVPSRDTVLTINGGLLPSYGPYVVKVYKVNQEYADLYESLDQDSRDLNEPPSNIVNARGIFSAFAADSVTFSVVYP